MSDIVASLRTVNAVHHLCCDGEEYRLESHIDGEVSVRSMNFAEAAEWVIIAQGSPL